MPRPTPLRIMNQNAAQKWGGQIFMLAMDLPTGLTSIEDRDCLILSLVVVNPQGGTTELVTVQDGQQTPLNLVNQNLAGGARIAESPEYGYPMPGGIQWSAAGDGLHARIVWCVPSVTP